MDKALTSSKFARSSTAIGARKRGGRSQHGFQTSAKGAASPIILGDYNQNMSQNGFRLTKQRREVYDALLEQSDHPTATDLFFRVKDRLPHISLATVYNCLETLVLTGLVKQVTVERGPARYCPNIQEHGHFHCTACGRVFDVSIPQSEKFVSSLGLPAGFVVTGYDLTIHGLCPVCSSKAKS